MARKIVITSGKGGVGKTTITMGLGVALAKQNQKVLLVDCDFFLNNLDLLFGIRQANYDLTDVMNGSCRMNQAIYSHKKFQNLFILPSQKCGFNASFDKQRFFENICMVNADYDFILFDCPSGTHSDFFLATGVADEALVVVNPQISSMVVANKLVSILNSKFDGKLGIIINNMRFDMVRSRKMLSHEQIGNMLKLPLAGVISYFEEIESNMALYGQIDFSQKQISEQFNLLANNIYMGQNNIITPNKRIKIFSKIKKFFVGEGI